MSFEQYNFYPILTPARLVSLTNVVGTYNNGLLNNGLGATLTIAASSLTIDSVAVEVADRILLIGQTAANQNGIYVVSSIASTVVLTRSADMQCIEQMKLGQFIAISAGTTNAGAAFVLVEPLPAQFGISDQVWTASPLNSALGLAAAKSVSDNLLPTVASVSGTTTTNALAVFADTAGTVKNQTTTSTLGFGLTMATGNLTVSTGNIAASQGNVVAGSSGHAGILQSFPASANGSFKIIAVSNTGNTDVILSNVAMGQASTVRISDPATVDGYLNCSTVNASLTPVGAFITKDVVLGQAELASSGHVTIIAGSGTMQFKVRRIDVNYGAAGLSGGGGDRLIIVTDGTTVYNNAGITSTLLGTPVNTTWGGSGNPLPGTVAMSTATVAGSTLYAAYSGGTTDYTAGSVTITVALERVA